MTEHVEAATADAQTAAAPAADASVLAAKAAAAEHQYALKNYTAAAELYSEATAIQAELNGEMAPENADLLYAYGRCLYHCGVSKSEVLGGKVAGEKKPGGADKKGKKRKQRGDENGEASSSAVAGADNASRSNGDEEVAAAVVEKAVEDKDAVKSQKSDANPTENTPFFQITGDDADWTDSDDADADDDDAEGGAGEEEEDEEDDFAIAYEVLDVARILLQRQLQDAPGDDQTGNADQKGKSRAAPGDGAKSAVTQIKERLADTYDLQGEIQLEGERFAAALPDFRAALEMKLELYPQESSLIAEAHYKLSLALEFASVTSTKEDSTRSDQQQASVAVASSLTESEQQVDEAMREEAASHMESAISSTKLRIRKEADGLGIIADDAERARAQRNIDEVKEMVVDMEQRLEDLRGPLVNLSAAENVGGGGPAGAPTGVDPLKGILGSMLGESPLDRATRIQEATAGANDLTGLVRHRKKDKAAESASGKEAAVNGNGKRSAAEPATSKESKKARVEDAAD